ncbi:MAG: phospholipase D-like domain-containing protein [Thermoanaerobaculia bacterium]
MAHAPLSSRLRPHPGHRLPAVLAAGRIADHVRAEDLTLEDPRFRDLLATIDGDAPIHRGNRVRLHVDGADAMAAMLAAVAGAARELLVESYIFRDDSTGRRLQSALIAAHRRGVAVRVLADAFGSFSTRSRFWRDLCAAGVETRLFHRLSLRFWLQPLRDHRKLLVADRRLAFTGGMNIGDEYGSSRRHRADAWRDTQVEVEGAAAAELAAVFSEGWEGAGGEPLVEESGDACPARLTPPTTDGSTDESGASVLVQDSRPFRGHRETAAALAAILAAAGRRVWITNSYFVPGPRAAGLLAATARRGIDVRLLLPGPTDLPFVRHAGHASFTHLLRSGVRIHEYRPTVLHAKTLVADASVSVVGSTNLDLRSFRYNGECNLVIFDAPTAERLALQFERDLTESRTLELDSWRHRPLAHRAGDTLAGFTRPLL